MNMKKKFVRLFSEVVEGDDVFSIEDRIPFWDGTLKVYHFNDDGRIAFVNNESVGVTLFDERGDLRWTTMDGEKVDVLCLGTSSLFDGVSLAEFVSKNNVNVEGNKYYPRCKSFVLEGVGNQVFAFYNESAKCVAFSSVPDPNTEDCTLLFRDPNGDDYVKLSCVDSDDGYFIVMVELDGMKKRTYPDGDTMWEEENDKVRFFR